MKKSVKKLKKIKKKNEKKIEKKLKKVEKYLKKFEKVEKKFFFSPHHSDQMSEGSQVSKVTLCVKILKWHRRRRRRQGQV